jgi:Holliday junction resolvasome RuvABC endonuclease subunit
MIIAAIDPGTKTGWAVGIDGDYHNSGVWDFKTKRHEGGGMRYLRFRRQIDQFVRKYSPDAVYYEEVRRHLGVSAAHVYGAFVAEIQAYCEENSIPYMSVPVGTIKKHWTGKGNASKALMVKVAEDKGFHPVDDNEADALAILQCVLDGVVE